MRFNALVRHLKIREVQGVAIELGTAYRIEQRVQTCIAYLRGKKCNFFKFNLKEKSIDEKQKELVHLPMVYQGEL